MREKLCLPSQPRLQCRDINSGAFDTALELASGEARDRFLSLGTRLVFDDDKVTAVKQQQQSGLHPPFLLPRCPPGVLAGSSALDCITPPSMKLTQGKYNNSNV